MADISDSNKGPRCDVSESVALLLGLLPSKDITPRRFLLTCKEWGMVSTKLAKS